ncbi:6-bladed beta-propeller [Viscerimonas tarda]
MKIYKLFLFIATIITLSSGCSQSKKDGEQMKYVAYSDPSVKIDRHIAPLKIDILDQPYSDFYANLDSLRIVKLETNEESLIGSVSRLFIINNTLFVADYFKTKSIFAFDLQGNFLYKINKIGKGPGEYLNLNMVNIDEKHIAILDFHSWKIIRYDLSGNLLFEKKIDPCPADFIEFGDNKMIFAYHNYSPKVPYQLTFNDSDLKTEGTAIPFKNTRYIVGEYLSAFQKTENGDILYHYTFCDTIYQIKDYEIIPKYHLSFYAPSEIEAFYEKTKNLNETEFSRVKMNSDLVRYYSFMELKDILYVYYTKGKLSYTSLVSKDNFKIYNSVAADTEKMFAYIPFVISGYHQNTLLGYIDESFLSTLSAENMEMFYTHLKDEDIQKIKELEDTDNNPVVCLLHVKKF